MKEFENFEQENKDPQLSNGYPDTNRYRQQQYNPANEYTERRLDDQFIVGPGFIGTLRTILHGGGWKSWLLKAVLYIVLPLIIIGLLYYVFNGTLSPQSFLSLIKSKNTSGTGVPNTGIDVTVDSINVNTTVTDEERKSYDYITRLLENIDNVGRQ